MNQSAHAIQLAWSIGRRFMWHSSNRFAKFVTWVSLVGLVLGVTVLTVVVTVMNGFDRELKVRLLDAVPHITIQSVTVDQVQPHIESMSDGHLAHVIAPYFRGFGAVSNAGRVYPIGLYGVDLNQSQNLSRLRENMVYGDLGDLTDNGIALSAPVARMLRLHVGDPVLVMMVSAEQQRVKPTMKRVELQATYELGAETDYTLAILNLARYEPSTWAAMGEQGVQIQLSQPLVAPTFAQTLSNRLGPQAQVASWDAEFGELFQAVQLEKTMMFLILLLVVAIAAFNIIAGQTMVVHDKKADIGILRTMGASGSTIRMTFLTQGIWVSVVGSVLGLGLGVFAAFNINELLNLVESFTGMHLLDGSLFVTVPIDLQALDLAIIAVMSVGLCLLSAYIPARRAADLNPVEHLH